MVIFQDDLRRRPHDHSLDLQGSHSTNIAIHSTWTAVILAATAGSVLLSTSNSTFGLAPHALGALVPVTVMMMLLVVVLLEVYGKLACRIASVKTVVGARNL